MSITPQPIRARPGSRPRMRIVIMCCPESLRRVSRNCSGGGSPRMRKHRSRNLAFAHDHGIGAMLQQVIDLGVEMGPGNDLEPRIEPARLLHDLPGLERCRDG